MRRSALAALMGAALLFAAHDAGAAGPKQPIRSAKKMGRYLGQKKLFRKLSPTLTRGEFDAKFATALEAPANLVRSYAGVFWASGGTASTKRRSVACSRSSAMSSSRSPSPQWAIRWSPTRSPSRVKPHGADSAGVPERFAIPPCRTLP